MGVFNGLYLIRPGKEDDARAFAAETFGARRSEFEAHLVRDGVTRETWTLQETPMAASCSSGSTATWRSPLPGSPLTPPISRSGSVLRFST